MKVIFMGTPQFAINPLNAIYNSEHDVVAVVCQQDKVNSRGNKILPCAVKKWAIENNVKYFQYANVSKEGEEDLKKLGADVIVTCAFGQFLHQNILTLCKYGVINIHSSLLPKYRGASPIISALLNGDKQSGVTIVKSNLAMDEGDILHSLSLDILPSDNSISLSQKISEKGAIAIIEVLNDIEKYLKEAKKQNDKEAILCGKVTKEDARLNFNMESHEVVNRIKAYALNPTAHFVVENQRYKVYNAEVVSDMEGKSGEILFCDKANGIIIACGKGAVKILELQPPNSVVMSDKAFLNGRKFNVGEICN